MQHPGLMKKDDGPGVPEALPRTVQGVVAELGLETVDRLWLFPPMARGRRESGLVAVSRRLVDATDPERRLLVTAPYTAERTGKGLVHDWTLVEQGEAPSDRLPRVMEGVVLRAGEGFGEPREVELGGDEARWSEFLAEFDPGLLLPVTEVAGEGSAAEQVAEGNVTDDKVADDPATGVPA